MIREGAQQELPDKGVCVREGPGAASPWQTLWAWQGTGNLCGASHHHAGLGDLGVSAVLSKTWLGPEPPGLGWVWLQDIVLVPSAVTLPVNQAVGRSVCSGVDHGSVLQELCTGWGGGWRVGGCGEEVGGCR